MATGTAASAAAEVTERNRGRIERARQLLGTIHEARAPFGPGNVLTPLNDLSVELANASSECGLLSEVHPDAEVRSAAEAIVRDVVALQTELLQDAALYDALGGINKSDPLAFRVVELTRRDMRRTGIELDQAGRELVRDLRTKLITLGQEFSRNIRDDVRAIELDGPADLEGLPADYVAQHPPGDNGKIRVTTDYPDAIPFMSYAKSERARRALSAASQTRATPRNLEILDRLLGARQELATMLGYGTWADYATEILMSGSAQNVRDFIARAYEATEESARADRELLLAAKRRNHPGATTIGDWESTYYTEQVKARTLGFDARTVRPYFEYRAVRQAILDLVSELFGIAFTKVDEPLWHPSVETFDVTVDGRPGGRISLDMHPREGKYKHAACFSLRVGVAGKQLPHPVLVCNFPDPDAASGPALMEHREVVTFFHEFGHLIHGIVGGTHPWARLVRVTEWDFIEAPSQFLEEWIYDFAVLRGFAKHVETGEQISEELVARLRSARDFARGQFVQRQLFLSAVSLAYHDRDTAGLDTTALAFDLAERYSPTEMLPESRFQASFGHLDGYTAAYYTYMWSLCIAKDLGSAFPNGFLDPVAARRYRDLILAPAGTKPAATLVEDFLGRPYDFEAFRKWLAPR
ncbi:MAG: Zn-dependent oligopeptidase [Chloroflexi bacterium]|nr:Zn-dependent oligopeptidase [Chloroflexota bacterium]